MVDAKDTPGKAMAPMTAAASRLLLNVFIAVITSKSESCGKKQISTSEMSMQSPPQQTRLASAIKQTTVPLVRTQDNMF